ncbi:ABC transporter permease [Clostridium sp. AM30-24]|nr:ABC transporter permease [Clostridium sp. AM30-24]
MPAADLTFSSAQCRYLEQERRIHRQIFFCRVLFLVLFLFFWEIGARLGILNDFIFSSPSRVLSCFLSMAADRTIFYHMGITILETLFSFFLVTGIGIFGAVALWSSRRLAKILEPYLVMLNSLPKSALAPVLIVWLGNNMKTIITAAVSVAVFGSILTLYNGFLSMDPDQIRLIYTLGGKRKDVLTKILLPGSVPLIISNMKVNIGLCLVGVIIGEFLSAQAGLGFLIIYGSQVFKLDLVIMSIVILCILSAILYQAVTVLEKRCGR